MKKIILAAFFLLLAAGVFVWLISAPETLSREQIGRITATDADIARGETLFWAGGCDSCHAAENAKGDEKLNLGGGHRLVTPVGVFVAPNISPDKETGIGAWSLAEFANAMLRGVSPEGRHFYPAFPYTSYALMSDADIADLWAFMQTLPSVSRENEPQELSFPFSVRRGIGVWKAAFFKPQDRPTPEPPDEKIARGRYLVEGPGHCGECHTPRSAAGYGGIDNARWLAGGPAPEGKGNIPNITPHEDGIASWSESDIAYYLETGLTPEYDSVGGSMVSVQENMAKLPASDREAIAAYLKWIEPHPDS